MIITKTHDHVIIEADEADDVSFRDEPPQTLRLSHDSWAALRHLTPEARALKELMTALAPVHFLGGPMSAEAVSALQEARVLVRRMLPPEEEEDAELPPVTWRVVDTDQYPVGTVVREEGDPPRGGLLDVDGVIWRVVQVRPVHVVVVEKVKVARG